MDLAERFDKSKEKATLRIMTRWLGVEAVGGKILPKFVVARPYTEDTYEYSHFACQSRKCPKSDTISDRSDTHSKERWRTETAVLKNDVSDQIGDPAETVRHIGEEAQVTPS